MPGFALQAVSFVAQVGFSYLLGRIGAQDGPRLENLNAASGEYGVAIPRAFGGAARYTLPVLALSDIKETEHEVQDYSEVVGAISGAASGFLVAGPIGAVVGGLLGGLFGASAPDQKYYTYSYPAVALAIADRLDDVPIEDVLRLWANGRVFFDPGEMIVERETFDSNGNLLSRSFGKNRYFESLTIYGGGNEQVADPVLEAEIGPQPGYRWRAYVVIKELQLEYFSNTFPSPIEGLVQARDGQSLAMFADAVCAAANIDSARDLSSSEMAATVLGGLAITEQKSCWDALRPILPAYRMDVAEVGGQVRFYRRAQSWRATLTEDDLGAYANGDAPPVRVSFTREDPTQSPRATTLTFIDPDRDYQSNTAISQRSGGNSRSNIDTTLALTLTADEAATAAATMHWDATLGIVSAGFNVTDQWISLEPGRVYALPVDDVLLPYRVTQRVRGANGVTEITARSDEDVVYKGQLRGSSGDAVPVESTLFAETVVVPIDMPMTSDAHDDFGFYLAMGAGASYWRRGRIEVSSDGTNFSTLIDSEESAVMGDVTGVLAWGGTGGFDDTLDNTTVLTVVLLHDGMTLGDATDAQLDAFANFAFVGVDGRGEYLQWKTATKIAPRTWQLTGLRRGRRGTQYAIAGHGAGEQFVVMGEGGIFRIVAEDDGGWGDVLTFRGVHLFEDAGGQVETDFANTGQSKRPLAPGDLSATFDGSADLQISWTRRSRFDSGEIGTDAPEAYEVDIYDGVTFKRTLSVSSESAVYTAADQSADGFSNGDTVTIRAYQVNTDFGRSAAHEIDVVLNTSAAFFAVQSFTLGDGTNTTEDHTSGAMAGYTPQAALVFGTNDQAAFSPWTTFMQFGMGALDVGGNQVAFATRSEHDEPSTNVSRRAYNDRCYARLNTLTGALARSATGVCIANGIRLTYSGSSTDDDLQGQFMAFGGPGVDAHVGVVDLGTGTAAIDVDTVGFQPDLVLLFSVGDPVDGNSDDFMGLGFGAALGDGTERCVFWIEGDGEAAGNPLQTLFTDCAMAQVNSGSGLAYKVNLSSFDADGFSVTPSASAAGDRIGFVALKFTDESVAIIDIDTPTSTGNDAVTGAGFTPKAGIGVLTSLEAVDVLEAGTTAQQGGIGISTFTAASAAAVSGHIESGADPTDTGSAQKANALQAGGGGTPLDIEATLASMDVDGVTFNYTAVEAAAKKGFLVLIGE